MRRGVGTLASPSSCSHERLAPPPTGDASVPTPLPTSPAPTNVTICPPKYLPLRAPLPPPPTRPSAPHQHPPRRSRPPPSTRPVRPPPPPLAATTPPHAPPSPRHAHPPHP